MHNTHSMKCYRGKEEEGTHLPGEIKAFQKRSWLSWVLLDEFTREDNGKSEETARAEAASPMWQVYAAQYCLA